MVGDSTDVREGNSKGFARGKKIGRYNVADLGITRSVTEDPSGLNGKKPFKAKRGAEIPKPGVYLLLGEKTSSINAIGGDKVIVGITDGFNAHGVAHFVVKVNKDNVEPIVDSVNLSAHGKNILRSDMGDPYLGSNRKNIEVSSLGWHTNLLD